LDRAKRASAKASQALNPAEEHRIIENKVAARSKAQALANLKKEKNMATQITMKDLLEAGVHFGHQKSRWNPKMKPYIFGDRNGIYIIDLQKTVLLTREALTFVTQLSAKGKKILFVGTKSQCKDVVKEEAERAGCPYVTERWLGGTLTNFPTIQTCLDQMQQMDDKISSGMADQLSAKERSAFDKEHERLLRNLGGVRHMKDKPGAIFIIDPMKEHNAVKEAKKLGIPIIAITDTNCDPDDVSFVIPGNDDALKSIKLFAAAVADAFLDGARIHEEKIRAFSDKRESAPVAAAPSAPAISKPSEESTTTDREGRTINVEKRRSIRTSDENN
jgi:small subunit ribosomal protein S2